MPDVTVITPTRDRPLAFSLCRRWMATQDFGGTVQWIVVDDGDVPVEPGPFEYLRRRPSSCQNTLPDNLTEALDHSTGSRVLIFEDDDFYAPNYISTMVSRPRKELAFGEVKPRYYNVRSRRWHLGPSAGFSSLCRTGFRAEMITLARKAAEETKRAGDVSIDVRFWAEVKQAGVPFCLFDQPKLTVSIKGLPGRAGLGKNHALDIFPNKDPEGLILKSWVGDGPFSEYSKVGK